MDKTELIRVLKSHVEEYREYGGPNVLEIPVHIIEETILALEKSNEEYFNVLNY